MNTPDVIDNRRERLAERVRALLADGATAAQFAVGYLFLDGLVPLREAFARMDDVQILIGNVVNRLTDEQVQEEAVARQPAPDEGVRAQEDFAGTVREARARAVAVTALNLRRTLQEMPRTPDARALLLTLANGIAGGRLKVRLYTEGRLHAKLALLEYPPSSRHAPRIAVVGSSNLTLGAAAHPTEMNVIVRDAPSTQALAEWYGELWDVSQDFHRELFEELGQSWALAGSAAAEG